MQSIAPEEVFIEVTGNGVEIGGKAREKGWTGWVSKTSARKLIAHEKAKPATPKAKEPAKAKVQDEAVEAKPKVVDTATEPDVVPSEKVEKETAPSKRVPRNGRK